MLGSVTVDVTRWAEDRVSKTVGAGTARVVLTARDGASGPVAMEASGTLDFARGRAFMQRSFSTGGRHDLIFDGSRAFRLETGDNTWRWHNRPLDGAAQPLVADGFGILALLRYARSIEQAADNTWLVTWAGRLKLPDPRGLIAVFATAPARPFSRKGHAGEVRLDDEGRVRFMSIGTATRNRGSAPQLEISLGDFGVSVEGDVPDEAAVGRPLTLRERRRGRR